MSFAESYEYLGQSDEDGLGIVDLWKSNEDGSLAFEVHLPYDYPIEQLKMRSSWKNPAIIELLAAELQNKHKNGHIQVFYEYFDKSLMDEIITRHQQNDRFPETQVWYIAYQMLDALEFLHSNDYFHGDLRPQTIHQTPVGEYVIYENGISPGMKVSQGYKSPEYFQNQPNLDQSSQDLFSLGITLIEVCTLDSPLIIYNYHVLGVHTNQQDKTINEQYIHLLLQQIQEHYSKFLLKLITEMVRFNGRPTVQEIKSVLMPYSQEIQAKKSFNPSKEPVRHQKNMVESYQYSTTKNSPNNTQRYESQKHGTDEDDKITQLIKKSENILQQFQYIQ